jgi:hypothetical protein
VRLLSLVSAMGAPYRVTQTSAANLFEWPVNGHPLHQLGGGLGRSSNYLTMRVRRGLAALCLVATGDPGDSPIPSEPVPTPPPTVLRGDVATRYGN